MEPNVLLIVGGVGVAALAVWGIFKLKNNLFVNTNDANSGHKTFYRNVM